MYAHETSRPSGLRLWPSRASRAKCQPQPGGKALRQAAADADLPTADGQALDPLSMILTMRARQAVRALAQNRGSPTNGLPLWAHAALPEPHLDLVNAYAQAPPHLSHGSPCCD